MPFAHSDFEGVVVLGPTASGKSHMGLLLAEYINGTVICADSLQVYAGLPLLTTQPTSAEKQRVPHMLYEVLDPRDGRGSVALWRSLALEAIDVVHKQGRVPIFVGGTGFYLKALLEGLSDIPNASLEIVNALETFKTPILAQKLSNLDPKMARRIHPTDRQRMIRALSVLEETGQSLSYWHSQQGPQPQRRFCILEVCPELSLLHTAITDRFDMMWRLGVLEEVANFGRSFLGVSKAAHSPIDIGAGAPKTRDIKKILEPFCKNPWPAVTRAIGFAELLLASCGGLSKADARALVILRTRQYAKRQRVWLRHQVSSDLQIKSDQIDDLESVCTFLRARKIVEKKNH